MAYQKYIVIQPQPEIFLIAGTHFFDVFYTLKHY